MALEALIFQQDPFGHSPSSKSSREELFNLFQGDNWSFQVEDQEFDALKIHEEQEYIGEGTIFPGNDNLIDPNPRQEMFHGESRTNDEGTNWPYLNELFSPNNYQEADLYKEDIGDIVPAPRPSRRPDPTPHSMVDRVLPKRRRVRSKKNREEIENQRMTHIAIERNRRKQMNEYLSVLRSLMPDSYVTRADQASIIGGAINFVKELELRLQLITTGIDHNSDVGNHHSPSLPFSEVFTSPQYSTEVQGAPMVGQPMGETQWSTVADVQVTMVETHASVKIRSKRRPRQLLKIISGLQFLRLTVLHLSVTTRSQFVLYSPSVKVEDDCKMTSVDEIATSVHNMLCRIHEDSTLN